MYKLPRRLLIATIGSGASCYANAAQCDGMAHKGEVMSQPSFGALTNIRKLPPHVTVKEKPLTSMALVSGTAHPELSAEIAELVGQELHRRTMERFADGEVSVQILDNIRGKDVYIIQPCAAPVNDSIIELLLTVSCVRRSGARRVIAIIPYFGYKHHRRNSPISTTYSSRYLSSHAMDFAKMLTEMGVDRVISSDLQRPGQGKEACFFDNNVPLETLLTTEFLADSLLSLVNLKKEQAIVVVAPNAESYKKAKLMRDRLRVLGYANVRLTAFFSSETTSGPINTNELELLGNIDFKDAAVVFVDDIVDTAGTLYTLSHKVKTAGASSIYACASHGLFAQDAMKLIDSSPVEKLIVTNTLPAPKYVSPKVAYVSVAPLISTLILAEHYRSTSAYDTDESDLDQAL